MQDRESLTLEMRDFLTRTRPGSSSNALAELRVAFPDAELADRVRVCRDWHDQPQRAADKHA